MSTLENGYTKIIELLANSDTEVDDKLKRERGVLLKIYQDGADPLKIVERLINLSVDIETENNNSETVLMLAAAYGYVDIIKLLIKFQIKVDVRDNNGETPLILASKNGYIKIVKRLINAGAYINAKNDDGKTALMLAYQKCYVEIVQLLIDKGAVVEEISMTVVTADDFFEAIRTDNNIDIVRQYLNSGGHVDARKNGQTGLMYASEYKRSEIAQLLINAGADVNADYQDTFKPLTLAFESGSAEVVEILINAGADIETESGRYWGETVLVWSAKNGYTELVELLIKKGANIDAVSGLFGTDTALTLATKNGHSDIVCLLKAAGVTSNL